MIKIYSSVTFKDPVNLTVCYFRKYSGSWVIDNKVKNWLWGCYKTWNYKKSALPISLKFYWNKNINYLNQCAESQIEYNYPSDIIGKNKTKPSLQPFKNLMSIK